MALGVVSADIDLNSVLHLPTPLGVPRLRLLRSMSTNCLQGNVSCCSSWHFYRQVGVARIKIWRVAKMYEWNKWPIKLFWFHLYGFKIKRLLSKMSIFKKLSSVLYSVGLHWCSYKKLTLRAAVVVNRSKLHQCKGCQIGGFVAKKTCMKFKAFLLQWSCECILMCHMQAADRISCFCLIFFLRGLGVTLATPSYAFAGLSACWRCNQQWQNTKQKTKQSV